jgi:hypothetical protein
LDLLHSFGEKCGGFLKDNFPGLDAGDKSEDLVSWYAGRELSKLAFIAIATG